jgi:glycosyltransferase involved in cell wall biosynthesis
LLVSWISGIFFCFPEPTSSIRRPRVNVLFTSTLVTSFIREDITLLRKHVHVDHLMTRGLRAPIAVLMRMPRADVTFTWFASVYSCVVVALARVFGKPSVIVVGGVDASREPEIGYGIWLSPWKSVLVRWAMRHATRLLVVDPFFEGEVRRLAGYDGTNIRYVPTGYNASRWRPEGVKEPMVLTVAGCHDRARMKKKGVDLLFEAAGLLPATRFVVIGIHAHLLEEVRRSAPANVEIIPFVAQEELLEWYRRAAVYCQPSYTEGLPNSLCEAMLCGCVPVGTRVGGIPTAIAGTGFLVEYGNAQALSGALQQALAADPGLGMRARDHIATNFSLERREQSLLQVLRECTE